MNTKTVRLTQIFVVAAVALYATFVFLGNLMDYDSNLQYVKHVLSMDTTFEGNKLMWRAITDDTLHTLAYWGIIAVEGAIALLGWVAAGKLVSKLKRNAEEFNHAKKLGFYAFLLGFALWFVGFICFGTEWFAMWQSEIWNGKETAMDIVEVLGIFLIIYMMPVADLVREKKLAKKA